MPSIKNVKRTTGDHHVQAQSDIHLETQYGGTNNGQVYIWGNLTVTGTTTTFNTTDIDIEQKVLLLNKGEPGLNGGTLPGVSLDGVSGISIERGGLAAPNENANLFFNQSKSWTLGSDSTAGMWELFVGPPSGGVGEHSGLIVNAIRTGTINTDLSLLGVENSGATVTLDGVTNYRTRLVSRNNPNDIPNKDYVDVAIESQPDRRRIELNYKIDGVLIQPGGTYNELLDEFTPGYAGVIEAQQRISVSDNQWITVYQNRLVVGDIKILDSNEISMDTTNTKLVLSTTPGAGATINPSVELKTSLSLKIDRAYDVPEIEIDRVKVYPDDQGPGGTGLYFVNNNSVRDELPSKRRAFFASLMF
jgi:hypothetical protein